MFAKLIPHKDLVRPFIDTLKTELSPLMFPILFTQEDLDSNIEIWVQKQWQADVDFETDNAQTKLRNLGLISEYKGWA